ncbi:MAG: FG-GAP repeat protein [Planctomycetota bacterium]
MSKVRLLARAALAASLVPSVALAQSVPTDRVLVPSGAPNGANYGWSVDADGVRLATGAYDESSVAPEGGAAAIFARTPSGWVEEALLRPPTSQALGRFGWSVAIDGDRAAVGEPFRNGAAVSTGAVHLFERVAGTWNHVVTLTASDATASDGFGFAVDLDGDLLVVDSVLDDAVAPDGGAVYVFERDANGIWGEVAQFAGSATTTGASFGIDLAIEGERIAIGAPGESPSGAAYVFERDAQGVFVEAARIALTGAPEDAAFGDAVALLGDRLLVGAPNDDASSFATDTGSARLFERDGSGTWSAVATLVPNELEKNARFGDSVALASDHALVGRPRHGAFAHGDAWLFEDLGAAGWALSVAPGPFSGGESSGHFGTSAAFGDGFVVVGSPDTVANAVAGRTETLDLARLYRSWHEIDLGAGGNQRFHVRGGPELAGDVYLVLGSATGTSPATQLPGSSVTIPLVVDAYTNLTLSLAAPIFAPVGALDAAGRSDTSFLSVFPGTNPAFVGLVLRHALLVIDPATFEVDTTNAVELTFRL